MGAKKKDGRTLRAERSRRAVAQAMLDLLRAGELRPTAAEVAEKAGVSLRLVFHHFKDMEAVHLRAGELQAAEVAPMLPIDTRGCKTLAERIRVFVGRRSALYEFISPTRRSLLLAKDEHTLHAQADKFRAIKRAQLDYVFREDFERLQESKREPRRRACHQVASWAGWENLRVNQQLSVDEATKVLETALDRLLT